MLLVSEQCPSFGHCPSDVHVLPSMLHCPGIVGQALSVWQVVWVFALQFPYDGQSPATKHDDGIREQVPACVGHWESLVQAAPFPPHVPELGQSRAVWQLAPLLLHVPGGQVVLSLQAPHSDTHRLQPGGSQSVVHVAGLGALHTGATMLQTGAMTLLHACPVKLTQVWGVMLLQVCEDIPPQVWGPRPSQV